MNLLEVVVVVELRREDDGKVVARVVVLDLELNPAQPGIIGSYLLVLASTHIRSLKLIVALELKRS